MKRRSKAFPSVGIDLVSRRVAIVLPQSMEDPADASLRSHDRGSLMSINVEEGRVPADLIIDGLLLCTPLHRASQKKKVQDPSEKKSCPLLRIPQLFLGTR